MNTKLLTYSGCMFDLLHPDPERVDLRDIAHALAHIGRFTGHGDQIFTDAQHSVLVCDLAPPALKRWALLHDAEEAYIGDVSLPMKQAMREVEAPDRGGVWWPAKWSPYDEIRNAVRDAVAVRFGTRVEDIHLWDEEAAYIEAALNGPHDSNEHTWPKPMRRYAAEWIPSAASVWSVELAEFMFLQRCKELRIS